MWGQNEIPTREDGLTEGPGAGNGSEPRPVDGVWCRERRIMKGRLELRFTEFDLNPKNEEKPWEVFKQESKAIN